MDCDRPLSLDGIWKGYSRGEQWTQVLANASLAVDAGAIVALTGSRLGGKTTLLKIAAGMERPDEGTVSLGAFALTDSRDGERSERLGREIVWIDRDGPRLNLEVSEFVGLPLALHGLGGRRARQEAARALGRVGAQKCIGRCWGELSNWQRVLVSLARAFAESPRVVIIDDLLDALGGSGTEEAAALLRSLIDASEPRCGALMSASDIDSAMFADQVWSITAKHSLKLMAGTRSEGRVIPFPGADSKTAGGPLGVGSS